MTRQALIISHADADGHLIAEQTRRNLEQIPAFDVNTVIDPNRTKDHRVWKKLEEIEEIDDSDLIFFVDLMFGPTTFGEEASALVQFVEARPQKSFFLVDHHPLPLQRLQSANNLRVAYRPEVFECAIGPRSGMMIVAALCEKQNTTVSQIKLPLHDTLAVGIKRAAALGGPLPGQKLLALLRANCWRQIVELGLDDPQFHRLPRGRRPKDYPLSQTLRKLNETASELLALHEDEIEHFEHSHPRRADMPYDFEATEDLDVSQERFQIDAGQRARLRNSKLHSKDLEMIVTLLEIAALTLTTEYEATFSYEELVSEISDLGGEDLVIEEEDIKIVLEKASFLEKRSGRFRLK